MSTIDIIRYWKDPEYREHLSAEERAHMPENPAGLIELTDSQLDEVVGGLLMHPIHINAPATLSRNCI